MPRFIVEIEVPVRYVTVVDAKNATDARRIAAKRRVGRDDSQAWVAEQDLVLFGRNDGDSAMSVTEDAS